MSFENVTPGAGDTKEYWYNLQTGQVEEGQQSKSSDLWGPFPTREEAANAMAKAQERNEKWDNDGWND